MLMMESPLVLCLRLKRTLAFTYSSVINEIQNENKLINAIQVALVCRQSINVKSFHTLHHIHERPRSEYKGGINSIAHIQKLQYF